MDEQPTPEWLPTSVEARFDEEGRIRPRTFTWGERRWTITDVGRQWTDEEGRRHILVMIAGPRAFELRFDPYSGRWTLKSLSHPMAV